MGKEKILLAHGSGGKLMHELIESVFRKRFANPILDEKGDSAIIGSLPRGMDVVFTTDSYVVNPLFFPGGDIGKLAVCGTINDLAVCGAKPGYISCGFIIEEGLDFDVLDKVAGSMARTCNAEGIYIVTGDIKVVEKGACDKMFINTSGIGFKREQINFARSKIVPGDKVIINGSIGDHGIAILLARGDFRFKADISSDCAPISGLTEKICGFHLELMASESRNSVRFMRDPTRGGLATTLNEIVEDMGFGILINEEDLPVQDGVRAACELLGLDPVYVANEGKVIVIVSADHASELLRTMRSHPLGRDARIIGEVVDQPGNKVLMKTRIGGRRIVEMLTGEQLPRIC